MNTKLKAAGFFTYTHVRNGEVIETWKENNLVVNEGLNYTLDSALSGASPQTNWYLGVFKNNFTPIATNVMATFPTAGVGNEAVAEYTEAVRPAWLDAGVVAQTVSNTASPAVFTFGTAVTLYGAFLSSSSIKGGTTGVLFAASKFSAARSMLIGDILNVTYTITATSV